MHYINTMVAICAVSISMIALLAYAIHNNRTISPHKIAIKLKKISTGVPASTAHLTLLKNVSKLVDADGYFFYGFDSVSRMYVLKSVYHNKSDNMSIDLSYNRLIAYKNKQRYVPPVSFNADEVKNTAYTNVINESLVLSIPVPEFNGLVLTGPIEK